MIVQVSTAIESQLRTFSRLASDGKFYTAPEYPAAAWHEAVVNACVHRSYSLKNMTIFVKMFDDRLVIESPGPFPPLVTPSNIYDVHHRRNFFLMDAMFYLDFVKCENEGTRRMRDEMLAMDLPAPEFEQKEIGNAIVRVTLRNNQEQRKAWIDKDASHIVGELLFSELSSDEKKCINFVAEYGKVKPADVQRITNIKTWHSAKKVLDGLVRKGILRYTSRFLRDPKSHYRLRNGGEE